MNRLTKEQSNLLIGIITILFFVLLSVPIIYPDFLSLAFEVNGWLFLIWFLIILFLWKISKWE